MQILEGSRVAPSECALLAQGSFRASPDEIAALRKAPDPAGTLAVHPALLRHADEQTVVGLAAVFLAIREGGLDPEGFGEWGVLAAPRYLGRAAFDRAFPTFAEEGAWGVSPHLIPAHSLHSPSGTISQALKAHGPNLGVGGTPGGELEAFLFATSILVSSAAPGVWVVLTGRISERDGSSPAGDYEALAVALGSSTAPGPLPRLRVSPEGIRVGGGLEPSRREFARWLGDGTIRIDEGSPSGAVRRPHFRPARGTRHDG